MLENVNTKDNEQDIMALLMAQINSGAIASEDDADDDYDDDELDEVFDDDIDVEQELPSAKQARKSSGKKTSRRKKADEDDDKSDGEDYIDKGISLTDAQNFRDKLGSKDGYTYRMSHSSSRDFIYAMRQKLMDAEMSIEDIVKYVKFYFFSWQGDFYVSAIFNSYFDKLTVKREKQTEDAYNEKVTKHDNLENIFTAILGDMDIAKECGSDGRQIDMLSLQDSMIDKPSKWSIHDVR